MDVHTEPTPSDEELSVMWKLTYSRMGKVYFWLKTDFFSGA